MSSGRTVRIGVLIPQLEDRYHSRISDQILRFFDGSGVEVFIFVGRTLRSTRNNQNQANYIYRMASASRLDGLLVVASSLANDLPAGEFLPFLDRYAPLPIVLHGWHHPRHPGVMIDNRSGMKELMEHFIKVHGMRQIAFLSGPPHNQDAAERLESYRRALEDAGIAYDPRLVVEGGFNYQYGRSAVRELLDGRGLLPRVIVAANDEMALAVSDELQERGIAVPDQVALGGFDNIQETEFRIPPITTVEQPLEQVTRTACQLLLDLVDGKPVPVYSLLPTRLVVRQSCGCSFHPLQQGPSAQPAVRQDGDGHHALDQVLFAALRERFEPVRPEWPLMEPVIRDLLGRVRSLRRSRETPQALIQAAQGWFFQRFRMGVSFSVWKLVLQEMQLILDALGFGQFGDRSWLGLVFRELFILVQELVLLEYKIENDRNLGLMWQFRAMAMDLGTIFEWDDFRKVLLKLAGEGRFASLRLFSYPDGPISDIVELPARARPLLAIQGGRYLDSGADGAGFPTSQILPSATDGPERGGTHIVYPLHFGGRHFGYIVTGVGRPEVGVLDFIQDQICVVIHNIWLMNELRTAQARLFQSEKMAALGNLVVGLAHEVNTPLGIGVTAASFLESELPVLRRKFEDGSLSRADLARHLEESQSSLELLRRNLERASVLVRNFKAIGAVQEILPAEQFDLRDCLQEIVQGMKPSLDEAAVRVALDGPPRLAMTGHPRALWQVVTHLIDNSLAHAFAPGAGGVIRLGFSQDERNVELTVSDDGHGIGTASLPRVFEPFFTTRRGQGNAGLGLSIVYHLVTSTLGGTIACSSPPGGGACFLIQIPRESGTPGSPPPGGPVLD